jgi:hypothetical protein
MGLLLIDRGEIQKGRLEKFPDLKGSRKKTVDKKN